MKANIFQFYGRGELAAKPQDDYRIIECTEGTVLSLTIHHGRIGFMHSFCRRAMMDRWGIYCDDPFQQMSNPTCTRSWARPLPKGIFVFRAASLEIVKEQNWMKRQR